MRALNPTRVELQSSYFDKIRGKVSGNRARYQVRVCLSVCLSVCLFFFVATYRKITLIDSVLCMNTGRRLRPRSNLHNTAPHSYGVPGRGHGRRFFCSLFYFFFTKIRIQIYIHWCIILIDDVGRVISGSDPQRHANSAQLRMPAISYHTRTTMNTNFYILVHNSKL